jgi:hypothetical protein
LRGANAGQDLAIGADVFVPRGDGDAVTFAGPYLRNRLAAPGDGIIGGTSAGYWVTLDSNGVVRVWRLLLYEVVAHSKPLPRFDDRRFHRIEIAAKGLELEVSVDGSPVVLEQDGAPTTRVAIPPIWETYQNPGRNQGAAGIAFGSHPRDSAGGQVAREIVVRAAR